MYILIYICSRFNKTINITSKYLYANWSFFFTNF